MQGRVTGSTRGPVWYAREVAGIRDGGRRCCVRHEEGRERRTAATPDERSYIGRGCLAAGNAGPCRITRAPARTRGHAVCRRRMPHRDRRKRGGAISGSTGDPEPAAPRDHHARPRRRQGRARPVACVLSQGGDLGKRGRRSSDLAGEVGRLALPLYVRLHASERRRAATGPLADRGRGGGGGGCESRR